MYLLQIRRLRHHERGKGRLNPIWTPWRTIELLHKLPDLREGLQFPSGLVEFRIQRAGRTMWRSDHRQDHKYEIVSERFDDDVA